MSNDHRGRRIQMAQKGNQEADFEIWRIEEDRQRHLWFVEVEEDIDLEHVTSPANTEPAELESAASWKKYLGEVMQMPFQAHRYVAILRDRAEARLAQAQARESRAPPGEGKVSIRELRKTKDLLEGGTGEEFYVLNIQPSFSPEMTIRVERTGNVMRIFGEISNFIILAHVDRLLSQEEWSRLMTTIDYTSFWKIPPEHDSFGCDGETWTIKGSCGFRSHVISRWSPVEEQFDQIRQTFLELAGFFPMPGTMHPQINIPYRHWSTAYLEGYLKRFEPYAGTHPDVDRALALVRYYLWDRQYPLENVSEPYTSDNAEIWKTYLRQIDASPFPEHPVVLEKRDRALRGLAMAPGPLGSA